MRSLRCKCGENTAYVSMPMPDCCGCEKCGTTYAEHPYEHKPLQPHKWKIMYNPNTGKPYKRCEVCYRADPESYKESMKVD